MKTKNPITLMLLSIAFAVLACSLPSLATRAGPTPIPTRTSVPTATSAPTLTLAPTAINPKTATSAQIAETVTRLFYTVDYQRPSAWLDAMQPYSTEDWANFLRDQFIPLTFQNFIKAQTKSEASQVKVTWKSLLSSGRSLSSKMDYELHLVVLALDPSVKWPGRAPDHMNVMLLKTPDGWRFDLFVEDEYAKAFVVTPNVSSTATPAKAINLKDATSAQIAETVTRLFYTVDYQNPSGWLEATQPYSTEYGVKIMRDKVAPAIWPEFTRLKTKVDASQIKVKWNKKITGGRSTVNGADWEIHIVDVTLDAAINWPSGTGNSYVNVMVERTVDGWRFVSFFSDEMTKSISDAQLAATK